MIGDKIVINEYHKAAGDFVMDKILSNGFSLPLRITVAGESGSGKSEIAEVIKIHFESRSHNVLVLGQDDYFHLPPHSNHNKRKEDISWVGPNEVRLDLLNRHVNELISDSGSVVEKPLVYFEEDRIDSETIKGPYDIVIAEGTYTSLLPDIDIRVFINRNYLETKKDRLSRNRDQALEGGKDQALSFLKDVLEIEHGIISKHIERADIIVPPPGEFK